MRKINRIEPVLPTLPKQRKVAVYVRVSKDTERLNHSISAQIDYYRMLIQKNPQWEYVGVYTDYGITGTLTSKRSAFQRMIVDCEAGKIDIIITKSISRFARNTVDLLETVRYLKTLGIGVRFEKEQIDSLSEEGELMLSLFASCAQEESRSISENIKWGIRKRFQTGEIGAANKHIFGYQYDNKQKKYRIIPEEAKIIHWIFDQYLQGSSICEIVKALNKAGVVTVKGCRFSTASLNLLLHNEIYIGDLRRQKYFVEDPITKKKVKNCGQFPQYYIINCHEAILDREIWEKVQAEMKRRAVMQHPTYCFTRKIRCGICGNRYTRKKSVRKGKVYVYWTCRSKKKTGETCSSRNLNEEKLKQIVIQILDGKEFDKGVFEENIKEILVMENGDLMFFLVKGGIKTWKVEG